MVLHLLARRYGSITDFSRVAMRWCDIARVTGVHKWTVQKAIQRYHEKGNRYVKAKRVGYSAGRPHLFPAEIEAEICSWASLNEMRFLSLAKRVPLIEAKYGRRIGPKTLMKLYKRNGVRCRQAKKITRAPDSAEARLEAERVAFARKLQGLKDEGAGDQLIYMDETTFMVWNKPTRTWMPQYQDVAAPQNKKFLSSITLYGAVGKALTAP